LSSLFCATAAAVYGVSLRLPVRRVDWIAGLAQQCGKCGAQLPPGAEFCPACGTRAADATAATRVMPAAPPPNQRQPQPPAPDWQEAGRPDAQPPPNGDVERRRRRNQMIAATVGIVLAVSAAVGLWVAFSGDDGYEDQVAEVLEPVIATNAEFNRIAAELESGGRTGPLVDAAGEAAADARRALRDTVQLTGGTSQERTIVRRALESQIDYARLVADRADWDSNELEPVGVEAENSGARLAGLVTEFVPLSTASVLVIVERTEQRVEQRQDVRDFASDIEQSIRKLQSPFTELEELDVAIANGEKTIAQAREEIDAIILSRRAVAADISSASPPDQSATEIKVGFIDALEATVQLDEDFKQRLARYDEAAGTPEEFLREAWSAVYVPGGRAEREQQEIFDAYNAYRKRAGLPATVYDEF
jgi:hypothetical protein